MAILRNKQLREMGKDERTNKLKELKLELIKAKSQSNKGGSAKIKEIKKIIARIYTLDKRPIKLSEKILNKPKSKNKAVEKKIRKT
jgi:ribosomal protein L29